MPVCLNVVPKSITNTYIKYMISQSLTWVKVRKKYKKHISRTIFFLVSLTFMQRQKRVTLYRPKYWMNYPEVYLLPSCTSAMELFEKKLYQVAVCYWVLSTVDLEMAE